MSEPALVDQTAEHHHGHRDVTGGWLRPMVFGAMDGLVSNLSLIAGVAGAGTTDHIVLIAGLAGLLAGAFSMAVGEWTSVNSQRELVVAEIEKERRELDRRPAAEQAELAGLFASRGVSKPLARQVAEELSRDKELVWRIHVREELGVDPDNLASPWVAGGSSFVAFAFGAVIPLLPFAIGVGGLGLAVGLSAIGLLALGAGVARFTGRPAWLGALRQLGLGAAAAAITYGVGSAFGVAGG